MIAIDKKIISEQSGIQDIVNFSVKPENLGILFHILRSQLYADPMGSVIREISVNAQDAHVEAKKPKEPISVSLPTQLDSFLKIRDFGVGLSDEEVQDIYTSYGASTKRNTNKQTGMLGLGSKSPFAYNDSFIVNSYKDGTLTSWNSYLDKTNVGAMAKMATCPTTEPNGLEIIIPVKHNDIEKFRTKAFEFFRFFTIKPIFKNVTPDQLKVIEAIWNKEPLFKGDNWKVIGDKGRSYAVMGNVGYPIDVNVFVNELSEEVRAIVNWGTVLDFKIGELEFSASREALQYTNHTKRAIISALERVKTSVLSEASKLIDNCKTLWEAKCSFAELFDTYGKFYHISFFIKRNLKFNNQPINDNTFKFEQNYSVKPYHGKMSCLIYGKGTYTSRNGRVGRESTSRIIANKKNLIVINDKGIVNGILNRVVGPIERGEYSNVYLLKFDNDQIKDEWVKDTGFDGPITLLSNLPKEPLDKYYPDLGNNKVGGFVNPKHSSNVLEYNLNGPSLGRNSDWWNPSNVDVSKDVGVYLIIDRFQYKNCNGYLEDSNYLKATLENLKHLGVKVPSILGIKINSPEFDKTKKNPQMVLLWTWIRQQLDNLAAIHPNLEQEYIDFHTKNTNIYHRMDDLIGTYVTWTSNIQSPLYKFIEAVRTIKKSSAATVNKFKYLDEVAAIINWKSKKVPSVDLASKFVIIRDRYPMFISLLDADPYTCREKKSIQKAIQDYITLIDKNNP